MPFSVMKFCTFSSIMQSRLPASVYVRADPLAGRRERACGQARNLPSRPTEQTERRRRRRAGRTAERATLSFSVLRPTDGDGDGDDDVDRRGFGESVLNAGHTRVHRCRPARWQDVRGGPLQKNERESAGCCRQWASARNQATRARTPASTQSVSRRWPVKVEGRRPRHRHLRARRRRRRPPPRELA